jgi:hypothetical protein
MFDFQWLKSLGVSTKDLESKALASKTQATANTAGETVTFDFPMDELLYGIDLQCYKDTDSTLVDNITEIELKLDGSKVVRNLTGNMIKAKALLAHKKSSTGYYRLDIADPTVGADPIPLKSFSSLQLKVTFAAGGSSVKNVVVPTLQLGSDKSYTKPLSKVLVETFLPQKAYGTNTGDQEYQHMRTQDIIGYIYELADNGSNSNTAITQLTLKLFSSQGTLTPIDHVTVLQLREKNTQASNGNALATGLVYVAFPDALRTGQFTNVNSYLYVPSAGTNVQAKVLESYLLGGN